MHPSHADCPRREDLEFGTLLGEGAFARVLHARDVARGKEYAVKIVEKKMIQVQDRKNAVLTEKMMLSSLDHPGIVKLHFAYQDAWSLYFGLELVLGGELAKQIERMGVCSGDFARFYSAGIVSILSYLRVRRIAHRDLKPENLLLTGEGHLKLVDFDAAVFVPREGEGDVSAGRSSQGQEQPPASKFAGTVLYLPPEVVQGTAQPHQAFALDLWALGCIIFFMLVGKTPFHAESEFLVLERIQCGDYSYPPGFQHEQARRLIDALLNPQPDRRPGQGSEAMGELERHAFFGGSPASFSELRRQRPPPRVTWRRSNRERGIEGEQSPEQSLTFFDFTSSAECTPELGQCFLSARATQVIPLASSGQQKADSVSTSLTGLTPLCDQSSPSYCEDSPHFTMRIESRRHRAHLSQLSTPSPRGRRFHSPMQFSPQRPQVTEQGATPPMPWRQPMHMATTASTSMDEHSRRQSASSVSTSISSKPSWTLRADLPGLSYRHWQQDLLQRRVLIHGEDIWLSGRVVKRRFPCFRPKILVLTNLPRLIVMDCAGHNVHHDFDLSCASMCSNNGSNASRIDSLTNGAISESLYEPNLLVNSETEFDIWVSGKRFRCCDPDLGSEEWVKKISFARERALLG